METVVVSNMNVENPNLTNDSYSESIVVDVENSTMSDQICNIASNEKALDEVSQKSSSSEEPETPPTKRKIDELKRQTTKDNLKAMLSVSDAADINVHNESDSCDELEESSTIFKSKFVEVIPQLALDKLSENSSNSGRQSRKSSKSKSVKSKASTLSALSPRKKKVKLSARLLELASPRNAKIQEIPSPQPKSPQVKKGTKKSKKEATSPKSKVSQKNDRPMSPRSPVQKIANQKRPTSPRTQNRSMSPRPSSPRLSSPKRSIRASSPKVLSRPTSPKVKRATSPQLEQESSPRRTSRGSILSPKSFRDTMSSPRHSSPKGLASWIPETPRSPKREKLAFGSTSPRGSIADYGQMLYSPPATLYSPRMQDDKISHNKKSISFGSESKRISYFDAPASPPVTAYTPRVQSKVSHQQSNPPFDSDSKRMTFQFADPNIPTPTTYNPKLLPDVISHGHNLPPFGTSDARIRFQDFDKDIPACTVYSPKMIPDTISFAKNSASFASESPRIIFQNDLAKTPGPAFYDPFMYEDSVTIPCANGMKFSGNRHGYIPKCQSPDHTHSYLTEEHTEFKAGNETSHGAFSSTSERFEKIAETPGPGSYNTNFIDLALISKPYNDPKEEVDENCNTSLPLEISFLKA